MSNDSTLESAARELREYGLSENTKSWLRLFMALTETLKDDLMHAPISEIPGLQAKASQLQALQDVVMLTVPTNGRG